MNTKEWRERLERAKGYPEIFELVKEGVENVLHKRRAGISLVMEELPGAVGGYHAAGSNFIVLNGRLVDAYSAGKTKTERNSLLFSLLLHEYIHSLGMYDEQTTRKLVYQVSKNCFGESHPVTGLAFNGPWAEHPELTQIPAGRQGFIVRGVDPESTSYIQ